MVYDVAIIGAGPAGAAMASLLREKSLSVAVLEKAVFPRFCIGESLLPQSMVFLEQCDLLQGLQGESFQRKEGAIFQRADDFARIDFSHKFTEGPATTWQVLREEFDTLLINQVKQRGADVLFDTSVLDVNFNDNEVLLLCNNDRDIRCRFVIDASGSAMVLPRLMKTFSKPKAEKKSLYRHFLNDSRSELESNNILIAVHPEIHDIWYWGIPLPNKRMSVGVVADSKHFERPGSETEVFNQLVREEPNLARRLTNAKEVTELGSSQAYTASVERIYGDRFLIIGNAGGFIDPIFSSGITISLNSAVLGAPRVIQALKGEAPNWSEYQKQMAVGNNTFEAYINSWYDGSLQDVIFTADKDPNIQQKINAILAGYAWDTGNSFVREPRRKLMQLHKLLSRVS